MRPRLVSSDMFLNAKYKITNFNKIIKKRKTNKLNMICIIILLLGCFFLYYRFLNKKEIKEKQKSDLLNFVKKVNTMYVKNIEKTNKDYEYKKKKIVIPKRNYNTYINEYQILNQNPYFVDINKKYNPYSQFLINKK